MIGFFYSSNEFLIDFLLIVELRNRAAALELERNSAAKFGPSLSRSRSAQSLKLLGDTATQVNSFFLFGGFVCISKKSVFVFSG